MRHIPTSLYIDTEVFKRNGLRLDTSDFNLLKNTFVKGGIRLLVPTMMERELLRHYRKQAEKCADVVDKLQNTHPLSSLGMYTSRSKDEIIDECFKELKLQWERFKSHFTVEGLPIVGELDKVIDKYFSVEPPFSSRKPKEFPDAFILSTLDTYYNDHKANIAVVSADGDFADACKMRHYIEYFDDLEKYVEAFKPELTKEQYFTEEPVDPTQPIVTEDLTELKAILDRGPNATPLEIKRVIKLLQSRGENYHYFFSNANEPMWIPHLINSEFFNNPPEVEQAGDGSFKIPFWPPIHYLERVFEFISNKEEVLGILEKLPKTTNPRVLERIVTIVLKSDDSNDLVRFSDEILKFIDHSQWRYEEIIELLGKLSLADKRLGLFSESVLLKIVEFEPDKQIEDKQNRYKAEPGSWPSPLYPKPRFEEWEYQEILEKGVRPLAEREPYQVARILSNAVATMIRLRFYRDQLEKVGSNDFSTSWCERVNEPAIYREPRVSLVNALTFACEKVYEQVQESVMALDQVLRNQKWDIFRRIRQHLYAKFPDEQTKPWIREMILGHSDYDKWEHHFEFQQMIRLACKHFGADLLTNVEKKQIFKTILSGPSEQDYRNWMGDSFTEEKFQKQKRNFHRMQLNPFIPLLFGEYRDYFLKLREEEKKLVADDDYMPRKSEGAKWIQKRSPKTADELKKMSDEEILEFLNEWENVGRDPDEWWTEITFEALAEAFQAIFLESIISDELRLHFWIGNREQIKRPIYVRAMLSAIQEHVKLKQFDRLEEWFELCKWILLHPSQPKKENANRSDESREGLEWSSLRRAVGDFVDMCVKKEVDVPISARERLTFLLDVLCTKYDMGLDDERPVLLNVNDQLTEAINNTRSRALESLVDFGYWVRRQLGDDQADTPEVFTILKKRIGSKPECPLTLPEYALLGMQYSNICVLNREWAEQQKTNFFPRYDMRIWTETFGNFLKYNQPHRMTFDILRDEIEFGIEKIGGLKTDSHRDLADTLGEHLFTYYVWEVYPLKGDNSLLEKFYGNTREDKGRWSHLFDHVGRSLKNSGRELEENLKERIITFFDWRFDVGEPSELTKFTYWLEAECMDVEWRLVSYLRILDICGPEGIDTYSQVNALQGMVEEQTALVMECFAKLTDLVLGNGKADYIPTDKARSILQAGLNSYDEDVKANAEHARENLLRSGHFDLLNLDD